MDNTVEVVLIVSVAILTIISVFVGVWLVLILKEVKKLIQILGHSAENVKEFTTKLKEPTDFLSGLVRGLESGVEAIGLIKNLFAKGSKSGKSG